MLFKILRWIPAIIIAVCNFYLSSQTHINQMPQFWNADKLVHFICFSGFSFWISFACDIKSCRKIWIPTLLIALWAVTDEIHQSFTPGRDASVFDWIVDTLGASFGALIFVLVSNFIRKRLSKQG